MRSRFCPAESLASAGERLRLAMNQVLPNGRLRWQGWRFGLRFDGTQSGGTNQALAVQRRRFVAPNLGLAPWSLPRLRPNLGLMFRSVPSGVMNQESSLRTL